MVDVKDALKELANMVKNEILLRLHSPIGNNKQGKNTLIGSELEKSIKVEPMGDNIIVFQIADYYEYVVKGRKAGWKNHPPKPPGIIYGITQWVKRKHIRFDGLTQNQTIWAVLGSLEKNNIAARPFIGYDEDDVTKVLTFLDDFFDKWADNVFEQLMYEVDKFFKS